jgi:hypothetical protein
MWQSAAAVGCIPRCLPPISLWCCMHMLLTNFGHALCSQISFLSIHPGMTQNVAKRSEAKDKFVGKNKEVVVGVVGDSDETVMVTVTMW